MDRSKSNQHLASYFLQVLSHYTTSSLIEMLKLVSLLEAEAVDILFWQPDKYTD